MVALSTASALAPHEVLVLVNANSPESIRVAREFARLRQVPDINIAYLSLPAKALDPPAECTAEEFTKHIWEPANQFLRSRQLETQVLAWVYSVDFPVRITTDPPVSLQGITFVRNELPPSDMIQSGQWKSPVFAGPDKPDGPMAPSHSMNWFRAMGGDRCPIPSMMLGFIGSRGSDMDQTLACLRRGAEADGAMPDGTVYFISNQDIRSKCRAWQYPAAIAELASLGIRAEDAPAVAKDSRVMGILSGVPTTLELLFRGPATYLPGCMAEHLTSCGAMFDNNPGQAKLTQWIRWGATASAGTVTEPRAIWTKFPNARFFAHYGRGCTLLESFIQAIGCPLQILLVGEPLARPWARSPTVRLKQGLLSDTTNVLTFTATADPDSTDTFMQYQFLLDGRVFRSPAAPRNQAQVDTTMLADGYHELRAMAWPDDPVRQNSPYAVTNFTADNRGRAVALSGIAPGERMPVWQSRGVRIETMGKAERTGLMQYGRVVAEGPASGAATRVELSALGPGTQSLQPYAQYADGETVVGAPVSFMVTEELRGAVVIQRLVEPDGSIVLEVPPGVEEVAWFESFELAPPGPTKTATGGALSGGNAAVISGSFVFDPTNTFDTCVWDIPRSASIREIEVGMGVNPGGGAHIAEQTLGLVFNRRDANNFDFFGLCGDTSAWVLGRYRKGQLERISSRGRFIHPEVWHTLSVRAERGGVRGYVNGQPMCFWPGGRLGEGEVGVVAGQARAFFKDLRVSPPVSGAVSGGRSAGEVLVMPAGKRPTPTLWLRAGRDPYARYQRSW